jgi:hypothetical protein
MEQDQSVLVVICILLMMCLILLYVAWKAKWPRDFESESESKDDEPSRVENPIHVAEAAEGEEEDPV